MGEQNGSEVIKNWPKELRESRNIGSEDEASKVVLKP